MRPALVFHPACARPLPPGRRFPLSKSGPLLARLQSQGLADENRLHRPLPAPAAWLELAHDPAYVRKALEQELSSADERRLGIPLSPAMVFRARAATGGTVLAARLALEHGLACNLAGGAHHAHADFGSGFCLFNDVAIATLALLSDGVLQRVLILDLDVHQGDGTASILEGLNQAFTLSVHCRTNFPARKQRSDLDVALDPGTGDEVYLAMLRTLLPGVIHRYRPDLVFYNAGVDPHERDGLGRLASQRFRP